MEIYSERIKPLFINSGKSDLELERDIGLPRSIIYDWDNKRSKSFKKYADKIAAYFNVSTDYLLGNAEKPTAEIDDGLRELLQIYDALSSSKKSKLLIQARLEVAEQNQQANE